MNSRTAKLLRKTAGGNPAKYKLAKKAYLNASEPTRAMGKEMMRDIIEIERQQSNLKNNG